MHPETIPMTTPLTAPIQARMGIGDNGIAAGVSSALAGVVPPSFQFELGEGSNKLTDARNLRL